MESLSKRKEMKTIDEVIEELQYWDTCHEYPECFYDDEVTRDALNYLKEYKRVQNKIEKIALGSIEDTLDKLDNKPLTWDELKTMEGKPVWVESHEDITEFTGWCIVSKVLSDRVHFILSHYDDDDDFLTYEMALPDITFGKTWQVYKKERNENFRRSDKEVRNV